MKAFRRLVLTHNDRPFLRRWAFVIERIGGVYLHRLDGPDPGLDLHDHPWDFHSIILRGGYEEEVQLRSGWHILRRWSRWSTHRMGRYTPHRILAVEPGTVTLILRGPRRRVWGFYSPDGWVPHDRYDHEARRPATEHR